MFTALPKSEENQLDQNKKRFYDALPADREFTRQEAVEIGLTVGIKELTVGKSLNRFPGRFLEQPVKYGPSAKYSSTNLATCAKHTPCVGFFVACTA